MYTLSSLSTTRQMTQNDLDALAFGLLISVIWEQLQTLFKNSSLHCVLAWLMSQCPLRQDDFIVLLTLCLMSRWATVTCTVWERRKGFLAEWWCPSSTLQLTGCLLDMWSTRTRAAPTEWIQRRSVDYCSFIRSVFFSLLCGSRSVCSLRSFQRLFHVMTMTGQ